MTARMQRITAEVALAAAAYSATRKVRFDDRTGSWVALYDFRLPSGYNRSRTDILLELPDTYPLTPPDWFFLDPGLRRLDGRRLVHYFEHAPGHLPIGRGWAAGSLHILTWRPGATPGAGNGLPTVCRLIEDAFRRWLR